MEGSGVEVVSKLVVVADENVVAVVDNTSMVETNLVV